MRYSLNDSLPDPRYHPSRWSQTAKFTKKLTKGRCCLCLSKATEVHHAYYGVRFLKWHFPVAGLEIPLWQVFPLCLHCHSNRIGMAHHHGNFAITLGYASYLSGGGFGPACSVLLYSSMSNNCK